ncbi:hypothetical protein CR205_10505 [Alteribacter lacisalsi]|uniref:Aminoglycoside phosphotransferase domain-containing protein n=1 Tax=Alteribacter lacisalsi TaxID=2045244 RepID=A0A2W0HPE8_9BACI|nr:aminoglycoside phosphotransferase family protein [Alteribacter lacisalsi]PYZ98972.1 hypothetical protein CR205_10505 [Alteribacter lacisalsi]
MKTGWERMRQEEPFDREWAEELLYQYDPDARLVEAQRLTGGLSNTNFLLLLAGAQKLVLRIPHDRQCLAKEQAVHNLLETIEFVPHMQVCGSTGSEQAAFLDWKKGTLLRDVLGKVSDPKQEEAGKSVGRAMGRFRNIASFSRAGDLDVNLEIGFPFSLTPAFYNSTFDYFFSAGKTGRHLHPGLAREVRRFAVKHATLLESDTSGTGLVHGDFNGLNILMEGTEVSAVLDWEFAMAGSIYIDLGNLIRYDTYPDFVRFEAGVLAGLKQEGIELPEEWRKLARLADLVSLCSMLDHDEVGPIRNADLTRLITQTVNDPVFISE